MNLTKKLITIVIFSILLLTSCQKANQTPIPGALTDTPEISDPLPTITEEPENSYPTKGPTPTTDPEPQSPTETNTPSMDEMNFMEMVNELSLETPASLKWCLDQTCIILSSYEGFSVLSYPDFEELFSFSAGENEFLIDVSSDGKTYAMTTNNEELLIRNWELESENVIQTGTYFMGGGFSPDGNSIMIASGEKWGGLIFDVASGNLLTTLTGFETAAPVYNVSFGQNPNYAIWLARATIQVSEIETNQLYPAIFHQDFIMAYDMNPAGTFLATSAAEAIEDEFLPTVFIYDFMTGELVDKFNTEKAIYSLLFSPDNSALVLSLGNSIQQYDVETKQLTTLMNTEGEAISQVSYSPDGTILVSSSEGLVFKFFSLK